MARHSLCCSRPNPGNQTWRFSCVSTADLSASPVGAVFYHKHTYPPCSLHHLHPASRSRPRCGLFSVQKPQWSFQSWTCFRHSCICTVKTPKYLKVRWDGQDLWLTLFLPYGLSCNSWDIVCSHFGIDRRANTRGPSLHENLHKLSGHVEITVP